MNNLFKILFSSITLYVIILFFGAYLTLNFEISDVNCNIKTYYDSLWWCLNATSIGDSNVYPITVNGRIIGVFLILIGYGLFTINVATICSILNNFIKNPSKKDIFKKYTIDEIIEISKKYKKGKN